jgi:hypothetical protein
MTLAANTRARDAAIEVIALGFRRRIAARVLQSAIRRQLQI